MCLISIKPQDAIFSLLKDGASADMRVDGSSTPVKFKHIAPAGFIHYLTRTNILLMCNNPIPSNFGNIDLSAGNGLLWEVFDEDDTQRLDFLDGGSIKNHSEFTLLAGIDVVTDGGAGDDAVGIRWSFDRTGTPIILAPGQYMQVTVRDNVSTLSLFKIMVQGYRRGA